MFDAIEYAEKLDQHVTLLIGVVAEHDSPIADRLLSELEAYISEWELAPEEWRVSKRDCLQAPPERHNVHVELRWLQI